MILLHRNKYREACPENNGLVNAFYDILLPAATIAFCFMVVFLEISRWFNNIKETMTGSDGSFGTMV